MSYSISIHFNPASQSPLSVQKYVQDFGSRHGVVRTVAANRNRALALQKIQQHNFLI